MAPGEPGAGAFRPGQRLQVERNKATVRYVGPVDGQQGTWVGLEWDDASRGKHDGSHGGKRYFSTRGGASSGSLVREAKLRPIADAGCSLLAALEAKYDRAQHDAAAAAELRLSRRVGVQLVGMEKLQRKRGGVGQLQEVSLIDARISSAGPPGELGAAAPSLRDLDLSSNLLSSWGEAEALCAELPLLHTLNLSHNLLQLPASPVSRRFPALQRLVLNHCGIGFAQAMQLLPSLPSLQELHLEGNGLTDLTFDTSLCPQLTSLKVLGLDGNSIGSWAEVCRLAGLPALERLSVGSNRLAQIAFPEPQPGGSAPFASLTTLLAPDNQISDWGSIDALHRFPRLTAFRLSGNPHPGDSEDKRSEVIARVGRLAQLNGSSIARSERKDCELHYLREVAALQRQQPLAPDALLQRHPRLPELQQTYGDVGAMVLPQRGGGERTLLDSMLQVTLTCNEPHLAESERRVTKPMPRWVDVFWLTRISQRFFAIPPSEQLVVVRISAEAEEDVTEANLQDLRSFESDGCLEIEIRRKC